MFLSRLILNSASRQVCRELTDSYQMHRTIMTAFPDHLEGLSERVLFRVDTSHAERKTFLLVQSLTKPDWDNGSPAFSRNGSNSYLLSEPEVKEYNPQFSSGRKYFFRLRANPTFKRKGKRLAWLSEEDQLQWLIRKGAAAGFKPGSVIIVPEGALRSRKHSAQSSDSNHTHNMNFLSVRFEGDLIAVDSDALLSACKSGIGSGKGLGFGLLSLIPR
ncbi:MAG: type I-E CRISPR-associated protein Cas6/Cse3/CasE [candidate division Zixibacteria bacterium]|nr:type I-E CRISPR-associated protein Cas6/Cse3/CasE [candidate division Zixibacteria bacterium]